MSSPSNCPKLGLGLVAQILQARARNAYTCSMASLGGTRTSATRRRWSVSRSMFRMKKGVTPQLLVRLINLGLTLLRFLVNLKILVPHCLQRPTKTRRDPCQIRVITSRAYHALFMHNMLIRPTEEEPRLWWWRDALLHTYAATYRLIGSYGCSGCRVNHGKSICDHPPSGSDPCGRMITWRFGRWPGLGPPLWVWHPNLESRNLIPLTSWILRRSKRSIIHSKINTAASRKLRPILGGRNCWTSASRNRGGRVYRVRAWTGCLHDHPCKSQMDRWIWWVTNG